MEPATWVALIGALVSGASAGYSGYMARQTAAKNRRDQRAGMAEATRKAEAERARLDGIEKERLERLKRKGSQLPPSMMTGMSGASGTPSLLTPQLGT